MKKSKKPTGQILIKAQVCSEWDSCNACLVEYTKETLKRWNAYNMLATSLKKKTEFHCLVIWEGSDFLNLEKGSMIPGGPGWCYVTVDVDKLRKPSQIVDALQIKFYGEGRVCFIGYGKHTSEEFWTETINIDNLKVSI